MNFDFDAFREKMIADGLSEFRVAQFLNNLKTLASGNTGLLPESEIVPASDIPSYQDLKDRSGPLSQVAMIKLNGGLGTSMGLDIPKSLLTVKGEDTFLDISIKQILALGKQIGKPFPFVLMNSFHTSEASLKLLRSYKDLGQDLPFEFLQSKVPKVNSETGRPVEWQQDPSLEWCPPGHGDIYLSLAESGIARTLLDSGIKFAFVSNIDNLGATIDTKILTHFAKSGAPFLMEVTRRTPADRKGGHLAGTKQGTLLLREVAQCPEEDLENFQDIERHQFFNTNNLWLNLELIEPMLESIQLPLIVNRKTVDPSDPQSTPVIQVETAMGAAIAVFEGSLALDVPRSRFTPVKNTTDLLLVRSNLFHLDKEQRLISSREELPTISLGPELKYMEAFEAKIGSDLDLSECESLELDGDISIAPGTKIIGKVHIKNSESETMHLKGSIT